MPSIVHGCGAKLHFPSEMAGRKGRCPTCGLSVEIPLESGIREVRTGLAPRAKPKKIHLDPPPHWEQYQAFLDDKGPNPRPLIVPANLMLKDEADAKWEAATRKGNPSKYRCPGCKDQLEVNAMVCTKCGLDLRTGRTLDGKTKVNEAGLEYLKQIPWLDQDDDDEGEAPAEEKPRNKPRFPNLRKKRGS